jgi:hypothetical protein
MPASLTSTTLPHCPACSGSALVRKVSSIYLEGTSSINASGDFTVSTISSENSLSIANGNAALRGTAQSYLVKLLLPPDEPTSKQELIDTRKLLIRVGILIASVGALILFVISLEGDSWYSPFAMIPTVFVVGSFLLAIICFIAVLFYYPKQIQQADQKMHKYNCEKLVWDRLYYCGHCTSVFDPQSKVSISAQETQEFLQRQ